MFVNVVSFSIFFFLSANDRELRYIFGSTADGTKTKLWFLWTGLKLVHDRPRGSALKVPLFFLFKYMEDVRIKRKNVRGDEVKKKKKKAYGDRGWTRRRKPCHGIRRCWWPCYRVPAGGNVRRTDPWAPWWPRCWSPSLYPSPPSQASLLPPSRDTLLHEFRPFFSSLLLCLVLFLLSPQSSIITHPSLAYVTSSNLSLCQNLSPSLKLAPTFGAKAPINPNKYRSKFNYQSKVKALVQLPISIIIKILAPTNFLSE